MTTDTPQFASTLDKRRRIRVLLVDPQEIIHLGFRHVLLHEPWVERLVCAHHSAAAIELARRYRPHVGVIAAELPSQTPPELMDAIHWKSPRTRILLVASDLDAAWRQSVGAAGVVPKSWPGSRLAEATRKVAVGMTAYAGAADRQPRLITPRERQVLEMIASGATNRQIATRLALSPHTVKDHTSNLYRKIRARNRSEAIVRGRRMGLIG